MATETVRSNRAPAQPAAWRVGELARQTGLTVRTLHYYDEIGLLTPSLRSAAGYRLYTERDVARLQQIASLRQIGLPLAVIADWLARPGFSALEVVQLHISQLREQIEQQALLCRQLEMIAEQMSSRDAVSVDDFIDAIERMHRMDDKVSKYYTPEQLEQLKARGEEVGQARIREVEAEWPRLIAEVKAEMDAGTDPADERVQALARRWMGLVQEFTGGDPAISASLNRMYQQEPDVRATAGIDMSVFEYMGKVLAAGQGDK